MARFLIPPGGIKDGSVTLSLQESRHATTVLRIKRGETVDLIDGSGRGYQGIVTGTRGGCVLVNLIQSVTVSLGLSVEVTLAVSVVKSDAMDFLVQKCCELGVSVIAPLLTERTVVRVSPERWAAKTARWQRIAFESCKQCGRLSAPRIDKVQPFKMFCKTLGAYDTILIPTLSGPRKRLREALEEKPRKRVVVFIGPEGDFTAGEVEQVVACGGRAVSLGGAVMRSETAALFMASVLNFYSMEIEEKTRL